MGRIKEITIGIEDRVTVAKFQSVAIPIQVVSDVDPGENVEAVRSAVFALAGEMWEKQFCMRLWWRIDVAQRFGGPMPEQWALDLYRALYEKHFNKSHGSSS